MRPVIGVVAVVVALLLASCSGDGGDGDHYVLRLDGAAVLADGTELDAGRHRLDVGEEVRITDGTATLGLPGDRSLELRAGEDASHDTRIEVDSEPILIDGHALLVTGDDETARVRSGGAEVALTGGAARIRRSTGVSVAVYEGRAAVSSLGQELAAPVRALRQISVTGAGVLPRRSSPLVFDRDDLDPWDRRFLGPSVELGARLDRISLALSGRLDPPSPTDAAYFRSVVPALRGVDGFQPRATAAPGETVVGASVALAADGDFGKRWSAAWSFRDEGADWGLVALDLRAARDEIVGTLGEVLDAVAESIEVAGGSFGGGSVDGTGPVTARPPGGGTTPGAGSGDDGAAPAPGDTPTPTPPSPQPPGGNGSESGVLPDVTVPDLPEPVGGLLAPVTGPVIGILGGVVETVGGLLGPLTGPLLG